MRENNRKPIERCRKRLSQFTTMNVIDGQAGLVIYSSLIFYSLTIDNILNIIVLLILAGVSIATLTGPNGLLTRASDAKIETALGAVKEALKLEQGEKVIDNKNLTPEILLSEGKVSRTVQAGENDTYYMYYAIRENAYEGMQGLGKGNIASLKDVFLIDDNLNVKYIASNGKEYGDSLENKVLEDETEIRFSSKAFSEYVSKQLGVEEEKMTFALMRTQTTLKIFDSSIDTLEDLVFFPELTYLELGGLTLDNLNGIENCSKLKEFRTQSAKIKDYTQLSRLQELKTLINFGTVIDINNLINNLSKCSKLKSVTIREAKLSEMKFVEKLENIEELTLYANNIKKVEGIEKLTKLKSFNISANPIKIIDDIIKNRYIESLTAYQCEITNLNGIEQLSNLKYLNVSQNDIRDITLLAENNKLTELNLKSNQNLEVDRNSFTQEQLEKIDRIGKILDNGGKIDLDVNKLKLFNNYTNLDLIGQSLTTLEPLEGMTKLKKLDVGNNQLTFTDEKSREILASMKEIEFLSVRNNKITNMTAINNLENLTTLYAEGTENNFNLKDMENLVSKITLYVNEKTLQTITNCDINKVTKLNINYVGNGITTLPNMEKFISLKSFAITNGKNISDFSILEKIPNIEEIELQYSDLTGKISIDFTKLTKLKKLSLRGNYLTSKDLETLIPQLKNNSNLSEIDLWNNSITDATVLLELNGNIKIGLGGNVNLTQQSKDALKNKFGNNVYW